jgi:hypothetical protein
MPPSSSSGSAVKDACAASRAPERGNRARGSGACGEAVQKVLSPKQQTFQTMPGILPAVHCCTTRLWQQQVFDRICLSQTAAHRWRLDYQLRAALCRELYTEQKDVLGANKHKEVLCTNGGVICDPCSTCARQCLTEMAPIPLSVYSSVHDAQLCHLTARSSATSLANLWVAARQQRPASYYGVGKNRCAPAPCAQTARTSRSPLMFSSRPPELTVRPGQKQRVKLSHVAGLA